MLKSISDEVELGPNLVVVADSLQIKARRLIALGDPANVNEPDTTNEGGVYLLAQELDHDAILTVHSYPREALQVAPTEGQWHIWRPYTISNVTASGEVFHSDPAAAYEVIIGIRRIVMSFRRTTVSDPGIYYERLDRYSVGENPIFSAVLEGLIELGVVERDGSMYRLKLNKLTSFGINYAALRDARFTSSLNSLAQELKKTEVLKNAIAQRGRRD